MINLSNKSVIVTGGTRGIGLAVANMAAELGARVLITGTAAQSETNLEYCQLDFLQQQTLQQQIDNCIERLGRVDVLINNAGINAINEIDNIVDSDWQSILQVNLTGAMAMIRSVSANMKANKVAGRIVNISSIYGVISRSKRAAYSASKSGLIGLTRGAALDLASDSILVNALCPGFTKTELTERVLGDDGMAEMSKTVPIGRLAMPAEIAQAIIFLASEANSYMTGQTIIVDGGVCCS